MDRPNSHRVERAIHEAYRHQEKDQRQNIADTRPCLFCQLDSQLHGQESEQSGELDDRVQGYRRGVFERVAYSVANHRGCVQFGALLLQFDFDDFLGIVPGGSRISHENRLVETESRNRNQIADEKERLHKRESQCGEEHRDENVQHPLLRIQSTDLDYFLAVGDGGFLRALQLDVGLDELHRAIGAGGHGLRRSAGEPINHGPAGNQAEHEGSVQQR